MDEIRKQVVRARRRLNLQTFLRVMIWSLGLTLLVGLIALLVPKFRVLAVDLQVWNLSWGLGSLAVGLLIGWFVAYRRRVDDLNAAIELDRRFELRERVSSSLSLSPEERESDVGQALLHDAQRRVERLEVKERFALGFSWRNAIPLVPAIAMLLAAFLLPNVQPSADASTEKKLAEIKAVKKSVTELEKRLTQKKEDLEKAGLKEAEAALKELGKNTEKLKNGDASDRKDALVKLNEMAKDIEKRRQELGGSEKVKKELEGLKNLDQGPADKMAAAMREGDLGQAAKEMAKLMEKIKAGELSKEEKAKLAEQLEQVKKKIEEAKQDHERKKQELKEKIEKARQEGEHADAAKMQQELDKLEKQDKQMEGMMEKMAEQIGQAAKEMREGGDPKKAAEAMEKIAGELEQLEQEMREAEAMNDILDEIEAAKEAMKCEDCEGAGCKKCKGGKDGKGKGGQGAGKKEGEPGEGMGEGQGQGARPEEKHDTKGYDSRVRNKVQKGKSIKVGEVAGPNISGKAKEQVREEIEAAVKKGPDAMEETALPRDQRNHSREYFEKLLRE